MLRIAVLAQQTHALIAEIVVALASDFAYEARRIAIYSERRVGNLRTRMPEHVRLIMVLEAQVAYVFAALPAEIRVAIGSAHGAGVIVHCIKFALLEV